MIFNTCNFNVIGKKNNQTANSDADREIPTLGSTDNSGNSINLVSGIIRLPSDGISLTALETDDIFYSFDSTSIFFSSQWAFGDKMTSYPRRCDVITSHRSGYDVILVPNAHWDISFISKYTFMSSVFMGYL